MQQRLLLAALVALCQSGRGDGSDELARLRRRRSVLVYRSSGQVEALEVGDILRDEEILPGFALPLAELFQD